MIERRHSLCRRRRRRRRCWRCRRFRSAFAQLYARNRSQPLQSATSSSALYAHKAHLLRRARSLEAILVGATAAVTTAIATRARASDRLSTLALAAHGGTSLRGLNNNESGDDGDDGAHHAGLPHSSCFHSTTATRNFYGDVIFGPRSPSILG